MDLDNETKLRLAEQLQEIVELLKKDDTYLLSAHIDLSRDTPWLQTIGNFRREFNVDLSTYKHEYSLRIKVDSEKGNTNKRTVDEDTAIGAIIRALRVPNYHPYDLLDAHAYFYKTAHEILTTEKLKDQR